MPEEALKALGDAVRARRDEIDGLSQEGLADLAGMHRTYVSEIERGLRNPSYRNLVKLAAALEVPLSELVARAERLSLRPRPSSAPGEALTLRGQDRR